MEIIPDIEAIKEDGYEYLVSGGDGWLLLGVTPDGMAVFRKKKVTNV